MGCILSSTRQSLQFTVNSSQQEDLLWNTPNPPECVQETFSLSTVYGEL